MINFDTEWFKAVIGSFLYYKLQMASARGLSDSFLLSVLAWLDKPVYIIQTVRLIFFFISLMPDIPNLLIC